MSAKVMTPFYETLRSLEESLQCELDRVTEKINAVRVLLRDTPEPTRVEPPAELPPIRETAISADTARMDYYERHSKHGGNLRQLVDKCIARESGIPHVFEQVADSVTALPKARRVNRVKGGATAHLSPDDIPGLLAYTDKATGGCSLWKGNRNSKGLPQLTREGKTHGVHRLVYQSTHGVELTTKDGVAPSCGNHACIEPTHLKLLSHSDRMKKGQEARAAKRGRNAHEPSGSTGGPTHLGV